MRAAPADGEVHGKYACENSDILRRLLREELGFKGFVISDWGATHDALHSSKAGLDIDMQGDDPNVRLPDEYHKLPGLLKDSAPWGRVRPRTPWFGLGAFAGDRRQEPISSDLMGTE